MKPDYELLRIDRVYAILKTGMPYWLADGLIALKMTEEQALREVAAYRKWISTVNGRFREA